MKNKFFALGAALLVLSACSKDDDPSYREADLMKKWYYVSDVVEGQTIPYDDHETCGKDYVEFQAEGVVRLVDVAGCDNGTAIENDFLAAWSLTGGDKLNFNIFGETHQARITKLTATTLTLRSTYDYDEDGDEEVVVENYTSQP